MKATFQALAAIYKLLTDSQNPANGLDFAIDADIKFHKYQPADFTIDGQDVDNGAYLYFNTTKFDPGDGGKHDQSHYPMLNIDICVSSKATKSITTGTVTYSQDEAESFMERMAEQIYAAISHASFRRKIEETIPEVDYTPSIVTIVQADKIGTLRLPNSGTAIAYFRFMCTVGVCELHGTTTGIPLDKITDHFELTTRGQEKEAE